MSAGHREVLKNHWLRSAQQLDEKGYFGKYSRRQRDEVLRKGFLGPWPPDRAIAIAREQAEKGYAFRTPKFNGEMRDHFNLVGEEVRETVLKILGEVPPECYVPPRELEDPPGCPFVFQCKALRREVYFKFQIKGTAKKPRVLFCSCHPPLY